MTKNSYSNKSIAIIDPVGLKAGMDLYDLNLCNALLKLNTEVFIMSNFFEESVQTHKTFKTKTNGAFNKIINIVIGHIKAFNKSKKLKVNSVIMHSFSFELKDLIALLLAKLYGIKVILILHDVSGFAQKDNNLYRNLILNNLCKNIVVHNNYSRKVLFRKMKQKVKDKTFIIKHGSFTENRFKAYERSVALANLGLDKDVKYILFFGQIKKVKGLDVLLKAFAKIKNKQVKLIIAGKPWEDDFSYYQELINELNIENKLVKFIEYIESDKRDMLFSISDFTVLPYKEIYQSGVLLMAMSNNIPVIASGLEPFNEVISDNNGLLFKKEDPFDLSEKIEFALNHPEIMTKSAKNAFCLMSNEYSWNKIAKQYNKLI
jgi:D-inositol-3-phosphate glycosyltransferase